MGFWTKRLIEIAEWILELGDEIPLLIFIGLQA